jgi:pimeloyl-ACP methyl ester carboxylesterase
VSQAVLWLRPSGVSPAEELLARKFDLRVVSLPDSGSPEHSPREAGLQVSFVQGSAEERLAQSSDVIGQGPGAAAAVWLARQYPERVQQLVLVSPQPDSELLARAHEIGCLTLIVQGSHDQSSAGRELRKRIPSSYLAYVYGAGPEVDADKPARFAGLVAEFLTRGEAFIINWNEENVWEPSRT